MNLAEKPAYAVSASAIDVERRAGKRSPE